MRHTLRAISLAILLPGCGPKVVGILPGDQLGESETSVATSAVKLDIGGTGDSFTTGPLTTDDSGDTVKLDIGDAVDPRTVVQVSIHSVSACALLSDGAVRCWGNSQHGELGHGNQQQIGDDEHPASAGDVPLGAPATQIAVGASHACAILEGGGVKCWGYGEEGALGYGNTENVGDDETPADVGFVDIGEPALQITAGWRHNCVLLAGGRIRCWGGNIAGQLGYGHTNIIGDDETPASAGDVSVGGEVVAVSAGEETTCVRLVDGGLRCWGDNFSGAIGLPGIKVAGDDELPSSLPQVEVGGKVLDVAAGGFRTCVLLEDGAVRCFGDNVYAALGTSAAPAICGDNNPCNVDPLCCIGDDETPDSFPSVNVGDDVIALAGTGYGHCALLASGGMRCWGNNRFGFMGRGTTPPGDICMECSLDPACCVGDDETPASLGDISLGGPVASIAAGQGMACAVLTTGAVRCWGYNTEGELGLGTTEVIGDDELPDAVPPLVIVE